MNRSIGGEGYTDQNGSTTKKNYFYVTSLMDRQKYSMIYQVQSVS